MSLVSMVLSLSSERVRVSSTSIRNNPNIARDTQHNRTCTNSRGGVYTDVIVRTYKVR